MLVERARIVEVEGEKVLVEIEREKSRGCGGCSLCKRGANGRFFLELRNNGRVKKGETVLVKIDDTALLKGVLFIYGIPAAGFVAGVCAAYFFHHWYLKVIVFSTIFGTLWALGLKKGNEIGKKSEPEIIEKNGGYLNGTERKG